MGLGISTICVDGPGAAAVDVALHPEVRPGQPPYLGWNGQAFAPGPAVGGSWRYRYRSTVEYERPVKDMTQTFYAKTYRSPRNPQPFRIWAGCIWRVGRPPPGLEGRGVRSNGG